MNVNRELFLKELTNRIRVVKGPEPPKEPTPEQLKYSNSHVCLFCLHYRPYVLCVPVEVDGCGHVGWICAQCLSGTWLKKPHAEFCGFCLGPVWWALRGVNTTLLPCNHTPTEQETVKIVQDNIACEKGDAKSKGWFY